MSTPKKNSPKSVMFTTSFDPRALVLLRKESEKTGVPMSKILSRMILKELG